MLDNPALIDAHPTDDTKESKFIKEVLNDFWICLVSRECSILGRREVLTGKAKFGILGDGKEVPQVAMARSFKKGDFRSGYYRDQTFMMALGLSSVEDFFAQLYADPENDPFSGGRQMNSHYATAFIDEKDEWVDFTQSYNISADISSTAGQMSRSLGLSLASKKYKNINALKDFKSFSKNGIEICYCTIGDASTSEGIFWETLNAAAVTEAPLLIAVWDDGYGISVPTDLQTVKGSISKALEGFLIDENGEGIYMATAKGWDYPSLCATFERISHKVRENHKPALIHVQDVTQPQGHSTSGSHERYKSKERLEWEKEHDCIEKMSKWMIEVGITDQPTIDSLKTKAKEFVKQAKNKAWKQHISRTLKLIDRIKAYYKEVPTTFSGYSDLTELMRKLDNLVHPQYFEAVTVIRRFRNILMNSELEIKEEMNELAEKLLDDGIRGYAKHVYCENDKSALSVPIVKAQYSDDSKEVNGYQVLNTYFDHLLTKDPRVVAFGEDVGQIGDVNQGFAGLQEKHGIERVFDTGIREWSIVGQAIGFAMRGLKPIAEIQYLDYLVYAMPALVDDLATLRFRSNSLQTAPAIIRTRGHRLEGIWHAGSPLGMIINSMKGMYILVPRNMVQAAGMYNTMIQSHDPALIIECLNGYRLKEKMPDNIGEYTVPLGMPEIIQKGEDVTLVTYGSCVRIAEKALPWLAEKEISVELIDVQTLIPFDLEGIIVNSLKKTNRIVFMDEDFPGGATASMMYAVLDNWGGYEYLDSQPVCLTASAHRPPFGSDGDYFSKPNPEDVFDTIYRMMHESDPYAFPLI